MHLLRSSGLQPQELVPFIFGMLYLDWKERYVLGAFVKEAESDVSDVPFVEFRKGTWTCLREHHIGQIALPQILSRRNQGPQHYAGMSPSFAPYLMVRGGNRAAEQLSDMGVSFITEHELFNKQLRIPKSHQQTGKAITGAMKDFLLGHGTTPDALKLIAQDGRLRVDLTDRNVVMLSMLTTPMTGYTRANHFRYTRRGFLIGDLETAVINNVGAFDTQSAGIGWGTVDFSDTVLYSTVDFNIAGFSIFILEWIPAALSFKMTSEKIHDPYFQQHSNYDTDGRSREPMHKQREAWAHEKMKYTEQRFKQNMHEQYDKPQTAVTHVAPHAVGCSVPVVAVSNSYTCSRYTP